MIDPAAFRSAGEMVARRLTRAKAPFFDDPVGWIDAFIDFPEGEQLTAYQREIIGHLPSDRRIAVRGPRGLGKSAMASLAVLWFAITRDGQDWKIITTASKWGQLTVFLWPEIHKWAGHVRWDRLGMPPWRDNKELQVLAIKLRSGQARAMASDTPAAMEGAHADQLFYILDEAKEIPRDTFDAIDGAFSGAGEGGRQEAYQLVISTPGSPVGTFYDIHARRPGFESWWVRHVSLTEAEAAGRVSATWADEKVRQWGEDSSLYQHHVLGNFASDDVDSVIPLGWVEAAQLRWQVWKDTGKPPERPLTSVGVDVGLTGDKTVLALRHHDLVTELRRLPRQLDPMPTAGAVLGILRAAGSGYAAPDVIGIGAGVVGRLREEGAQVKPFNAAVRTAQVDLSGELGFVNLRAAGWWTMRELLDPANGFEIALPPDDELTGDLTAPRWRHTSGGRIQVESKDEIRKRLGRSTDVGDAVMMAFALIPEPPPEEGLVVFEDRVSISPY